MLARARRQCEAEGRAPTRFTLRPDLPTMAMNDPGDDRQPKSKATEILFSMKDLERCEELRLVARIETGPVVSQKKAAVQRAAELNAGPGPSRRESPGVFEQLHQR